MVTEGAFAHSHLRIILESHRPHCRANVCSTTTWIEIDVTKHRLGDLALLNIGVNESCGLLVFFPNITLRIMCWYLLKISLLHAQSV